MRGLGSGIREFKNAANPNEDKESKNDAPKGE
jgi:Sec-independent protein translocase protein TatA